jgi:hypothetical protein
MQEIPCPLPLLPSPPTSYLDQGTSSINLIIFPLAALFIVFPEASISLLISEFDCPPCDSKNESEMLLRNVARLSRDIWHYIRNHHCENLKQIRLHYNILNIGRTRGIWHPRELKLHSRNYFIFNYDYTFSGIFSLKGSGG